MEQAPDFSAHSPVQASMVTLFKYCVFIPLEKYFNLYCNNNILIISLENYMQYILGLCHCQVFIGNVVLFVHDKSNYLVNWIIIILLVNVSAMQISKSNFMVKPGVIHSVFKVPKIRFRHLRNVYGTTPPPSGQNLKQRSWIPSCFAVPADLCATVARLTVATGSGHVVPTLPLTNIAFKRGSQILGGIRSVEQSWTPSTPSTTR